MTQAHWQRIAQWPLMVAAVVFLVAYSIEVIVDPTGPGAIVPEVVIWATWGLFVLDYVVNLILAEHRGRWFIHHLFDLAVVVLPMLRPLRLLRLVTLLSVLQRTAGRAFRGRLLIYVGTASALLIYVAALAVVDAERGHGGQIQTVPEGIWWAFVTITTVGYGDYVPVTGVGQFVAVGIMIGGIALIGVVTATLASWIIEKVDEGAVRKQAASEAQVTALHEEVIALRELLADAIASRDLR